MIKYVFALACHSGFSGWIDVACQAGYAFKGQIYKQRIAAEPGHLERLHNYKQYFLSTLPHRPVDAIWKLTVINFAKIPQ
jgi:hypothetical protein